MIKQDFALSYYAPLSEQDFTNLTVSGCKRVLLGYSVAHSRPDILSRLSGLSCHLVLRIEQQNTDSPAALAASISTMHHILPIDAVIIGTEPDAGIDFTYRDTQFPDGWGQPKAYETIKWVKPLIQAIQALGLSAVAPAMTWPPDMISEDGIPQPGRTTFREITAPTFNTADGIGSHCGYVLGWDGNSINPTRFKNGLKRSVEEWHKPLWIDECSFPTDNDVLQMQCALDLADIIMRSHSNERVKLLSPFCSSGFPTAWPAQYLIRDPRAYELLAHWLTS